LILCYVALSPASAYAEELDTPVHEDPIDEIQSDSDWVTGHFSFNCTYLWVTNLVSFDAYSYCSFEWTEGISGRFTSVSIYPLNMKINGISASVIDQSDIQIESYSLGKKATRRFLLSNLIGDHAYIEIRVFVDEYGVLSIHAVPATSL